MAYTAIYANGSTFNMVKSSLLTRSMKFMKLIQVSSHQVVQRLILALVKHIC